MSEAEGMLPDRRAPTLRNRLLDLSEIILYQIFRRLPIDLAPDLSERSVPRDIRANRPWVVERARANLKRHRPEASEAEIERSVEAFLRNIGRFIGETATIGRQAVAGRIEFVHPVSVRERWNRRPILAIMVHTGNWEVMAEAFKVAGLSVAVIPIDWESRAQTWILTDMRRRNGLRLLSSDQSGLRAMVTELREGGIFCIFVDEARDGKLMGPLFGRAPHMDGNLGVAAKLARRFNAPVALCYATRTANNHFRVFFGDPMDLPPPTGNPLDDVLFLNGLIEPVILEHLDQWFWLDDEF